MTRKLMDNVRGQASGRVKPTVGATYSYEDASGGANDASLSDNPNPYAVLIEACQNDPVKIQERYLKHRTVRAEKQREVFLSPSFPGFNIDTILAEVLREEQRPDDKKTGFKDTRHNLSLWGRPSNSVTRLVEQIQERLRAVVPDLWCMPLDRLHMTCMEVTHSRTQTEIDGLIAPVTPPVSNMAADAANVPYYAAKGVASNSSGKSESEPSASDKNNNNVRTGRYFRLVKPMVSFDATAMALCWVPATSPLRAGQVEEEHKPRSSSRSGSGTGSGSGLGSDGTKGETYHHLRAGLWDMISSSSVLNRTAENGDKDGSVDGAGTGGNARDGGRGIAVQARYVVPSAHITIARYLSQASISADGTEEGPISGEKVARFVREVESINAWLVETTWPPEDSPEVSSESQGQDGATTGALGWAGRGGEWLVGQDRGIEFRAGVSWYGGGYGAVLGTPF